MLQIAICDDNIQELSNIVQLLHLYQAEKSFPCDYAAFSNGFELLFALEKGKRFDLFLLDIIMPGLTGMEIAAEIRAHDKAVPIIFFTSSPDYALQSYTVKAVNYVLKPISKATFFLTLDELLHQMKLEKQEDILVIKSQDGIQKIHLSTLLFVEVVGRYVYYHLISGKVISCLESFATVCDKLSRYPYFLKTHRSYLVNMQYIDIIDTKQITLQTAATIPIAQGKAREIKQHYLTYQMEG